ncbi:hypothetical protein OIU84_020229 [Salix udensis]|uniref:F-box domain-containing protein n=1 Tax=Salix udensis TaxID=889485 RepID=A0AAD6PLY0_9ROSI|nr:hypothetical protein OIU84_020229 [Salix udensis]
MTTFFMAETSTSTTSSSIGSSPPPPPPIVKLAQDHLFTILVLLPIDSLISFARTCKRFRSFNKFGYTVGVHMQEGVGVHISGCPQVFYQFQKQSAVAMDEAIQAGLLTVSTLYLIAWSCLVVAVKELFSVPDSTNFGYGIPLLENLLASWSWLQSISRDLDDTWVAYIGNDFQRMLKWQKVNSGIPNGRFGHSCIVIGDHLVLFGGINDRGMRHNDTWVGKVVLSENLGITLSWRLLDVRSIAPPPRGAHAACCIDKSTMVIHGGIGLYGRRWGDTWILELSENLCSGTWRELVTHPSPPARSGHTLTCIERTGTVLFGGRGSGYDVLHDVWLLQVSEDQLKWIQILYNLHDIPAGVALPRVGHSATLILGRSAANIWWQTTCGKCSRAKGYKPNRRSFHRACADHSGCRLYILGGMVDGLLQPAEAYGLRFDGELFLVKLELETNMVRC